MNATTPLGLSVPTSLGEATQNTISLAAVGAVNATAPVSARQSLTSELMNNIQQYAPSWSNYFEAIAIFCFLLALLWLFVWLLRKRSDVRSRQGVGLYLESRLALGPKKWLVVARFMDKQILLGVTDERISLLSEQACPPSPSFANELGKAVKNQPAPAAPTAPRPAAQAAPRPAGQAAPAQSAPRLTLAETPSKVTYHPSFTDIELPKN